MFLQSFMSNNKNKIKIYIFCSLRINKITRMPNSARRPPVGIPGLAVRILCLHLGGPGLTPGMGTHFFYCTALLSELHSMSDTVLQAAAKVQTTAGWNMVSNMK